MRFSFASWKTVEDLGLGRTSRRRESASSGGLRQRAVGVLGSSRSIPALAQPSPGGIPAPGQRSYGGNTQRVENDVNRGAVSQEWHIFNGQNLRNNTLVTVTTSQLVTMVILRR